MGKEGNKREKFFLNHSFVLFEFDLSVRLINLNLQSLKIGEIGVNLPIPLWIKTIIVCKFKLFYASKIFFNIYLF